MESTPDLPSQSTSRRKNQARRGARSRRRRDRGHFERSKVLQTHKSLKSDTLDPFQDRQCRQVWTSHRGDQESRALARITTPRDNSLQEETRKRTNCSMDTGGNIRHPGVHGLGMEERAPGSGKGDSLTAS